MGYLYDDLMAVSYTHLDVYKRQGNIELNSSNYVVNEEEFQTTPILFRDKSGEIHYLNVHKRPIKNGEKLIGTLIIMIDVTALVQMQESLRGQKSGWN